MQIFIDLGGIKASSTALEKVYLKYSFKSYNLNIIGRQTAEY